MNHLDDLTAAFESMAERGTHRGAADVLDAATGPHGTSPHRTRRAGFAVVAVAAGLLLLAFGLWQFWPDDSVGVVHTTPDTRPADELPNGVPVDSLTIPWIGTSISVAEGFGRIWVATGHDSMPSATDIRVFDQATGELVGSVTAPGATAPRLTGSTGGFTMSDHYLWVRTSVEGPAVPELGGGANVLYRIDPETLEATPQRYLSNDGPAAAFGDRVVVADHDHLEIVGEDGSEIATRTVDEVVGIDQANIPGTNGLGWAHLGPEGLWIVHSGRGLVIRLDPDTGERLASDDMNAESSPPAAGAHVAWLTATHSEQTNTGVGVITDGSSTDPVQRVRADLGPTINVLGTLDDNLLLGEPLAVIDPVSGTSVTVPDSGGQVGGLTAPDGRLAMWHVDTPGQPIVIRFVDRDTLIGMVRPDR